MFQQIHRASGFVFLYLRNKRWYTGYITDPKNIFLLIGVTIVIQQEKTAVGSKEIAERFGIFGNFRGCT
jgi:hypothetical protein